MPKQILDIGNCGPDHAGFSQLVRDHFGASVTLVDDLEHAMQALSSDQYDLIIVNRLVDRCGSEGLAVIESIKANAQYNQVPIMMVTNYDDHQQLAQDAGAVRGFGKSSLRAPETVELLGAYLA